MYLAGALLAGTTMFSSCSNDDEPAISNEKVLAKITMGIEGLPQTKQSADDVNQDGTAKDIPSIVIVPMVSNTWLDAIPLGALNAKTSTTQSYTNVAITNGVNKFRVYGGEATKVKAPITSATQFELEADGTVDEQNVYKPAGLYYYTETKEAHASESRDVTIKAKETQQAAVDKTTTQISISGVRYGVGLLTTRVSAASDIKYVNEDGQATGETVPFGGELTLTGIYIGSQPASVNAAFEPNQEGSGASTRIVQDTNIASGKITSNDDASSVAINNYTTLFQTMPNEQAAVVLRLISDTEIYAKGADGNTYKVVNPETPFYVKAVLAPANAASGNQTSLFQKFYNTKANLKINSLANATTELPDITPTDITLDVTVDLSWEEGFVFNETID